jgi:hypothetical protein
MRMNRRGLVLGGLLATLVASSASAYSVTTTLTVNGKSTGPVTILLGANADTRGHNHYDVWVGPVPVPSTGYVLHSVAYLPFKRPVISGGNQPIKAFTVDVNPVTGKTGWNYRNQFTVWTTADGDLNSLAQAEIKSGSTNYHNTHGTGTGHNTDSNRLILVVTK